MINDLNGQMQHDMVLMTSFELFFILHNTIFLDPYLQLSEKAKITNRNLYIIKLVIKKINTKTSAWQHGRQLDIPEMESVSMRIDRSHPL